MNNAFEEAKPVIQTLQAHGYEAFFVGGAVRDSLLNRPIGDVDIATSARPEEVQAIFTKVIPIGIEHGTVMVRYDKQSYEVTTYRVEAEYNDYRHPDEVQFVKDIRDDLSRRDFTMNAIAMNIEGNLIDPFNGREAISLHTIKTVGNAHTRFSEDPLRMMRALRFVSQLGFHLSEETWHAIQQNASLLTHIAVERNAVELEKLVQGTFAHQAWNLLVDSKIGYYLPVFKNDPSMMQKCKELSWIPLDDLSEAIAVFHILYPTLSIDQWAKEWKLSNQQKRKAALLADMIHQYDKASMAWLVYQLHEENLAAFERIAHLLSLEGEEWKYENTMRIYTRLPIYSKQQLAISGLELKEWFHPTPPGPWMKRFLHRLEHAVVTEELPNDREAMKEKVLEWSQREES